MCGTGGATFPAAESLMSRLQALEPRLQQQSMSRAPVMQPGSWRTDQTSSAKRGYGYAWQKSRDGHLRSHPLCVLPA